MNWHEWLMERNALYRVLVGRLGRETEQVATIVIDPTPSEAMQKLREIRRQHEEVMLSWRREEARLQDLKNRREKLRARLNVGRKR